jgi:hypothetical protein
VQAPSRGCAARETSGRRPVLGAVEDNRGLPLESPRRSKAAAMEPVLISYRCRYCHHTWTEPRVSTRQRASYDTVWCSRCGVLSPKRTQRIRYIEDRVGFTDPIAVQRLVPGQTYIIAHVDRLQHCTLLALCDVTGVFNVLSFCPVTFVREQEGEQHGSDRPSCA